MVRLRNSIQSRARAFDNRFISKALRSQDRFAGPKGE